MSLEATSGVGTACRPTDEEQDERDHVADAIERDASERPSARHRRLAAQPSGAQHLADANGQDVVAREAAEHHLVEPPQPDLRRRRDLAPAGRLDEVADHERRATRAGRARSVAQSQRSACTSRPRAIQASAMSPLHREPGRKMRARSRWPAEARDRATPLLGAASPHHLPHQASRRPVRVRRTRARTPPEPGARAGGA